MPEADTDSEKVFVLGHIIFFHGAFSDMRVHEWLDRLLDDHQNLDGAHTIKEQLQLVLEACKTAKRRVYTKQSWLESSKSMDWRVRAATALNGKHTNELLLDDNLHVRAKAAEWAAQNQYRK